MICSRRRARRYCPRRGREICSRCCGRERSLDACSDSCVYLEPLLLKAREERGELPVYRVLIQGHGSVVVVVAREKPDGMLQYISVLIDEWKMGLKECHGSHGAAKLEFHNMLKQMEEAGGFEEITLKEAVWHVKHGLRIANALGTSVPREFWEFKYVLGDMEAVEVGGSLYKCFNCGKGELSEEVVEAIKKVTRRDVEAGVCGTPEETPIFFTCKECKGELSEVNVKEYLAEYALTRYLDRLKEAYLEYPYDDVGMDEELAFHNYLDWFILEWRNPVSGKTIAEEFAEERVEDEGLRRKLLQTTQVTSGVFEVVENMGGMVVVRDEEDREYRVEISRGREDIYRKGTIVMGRLHPWGDAYRFCGVNLCSISGRRMPWGLPDPEEFMAVIEEGYIRDAEEITIYPDSRVTSLLNKYPAEWVNGICLALGLSSKGKKREKVKKIAGLLLSPELVNIVKKLPGDCREALELVLDRGGRVRYGELSRKYSSDIGYWWSDDKPSSVLGLLRVNGLLYVGRMYLKSRRYKVAFIPRELREDLRKALEAC